MYVIENPVVYIVGNIELHKLVKERRMGYSIKGFTEVQSYDNDNELTRKAVYCKVKPQPISHASEMHIYFLI